MDRNFFQNIIDLFEEVYNSQDPRLFEAMNSEDDVRGPKVYLTAPHFMLELFWQALAFVGRHHHIPPGQIPTWRGLQVSPNPDLKISIFHRDYPLYKEDWMICEVSLVTLQRRGEDECLKETRSEEYYQQYLGSLRQYFDIDPKKWREN
ncbi:hypothetical protein SAMN05421823_102500 [Catalinimonas alkaloidigena]|uniref:Uncharacterized protein n=1 Tax=Catalinimonas alkaloidigena TaxID=1075417 RepID=A0A1G9B3D9_9BACT|nr:hypothetical protein [Catalinimonas alkaloidigena]SDK34069.1 hypothetical protein SAMN05421823_102500 [Catalinimonas alkaloidigena]